MRSPYSLLARKTKHGKTIYYVRFWLDNERIYTTPKSSGQTSKVGARRWADGCLRNGNIITKECTAFDAFAANFFTIDSEYINHLRLRRKAIEAAHLKDAQAQLDNYAIPFFRDKTLSRIENEDLEQFRDMLIERRLSSSTMVMARLR